jgi:hypothetical protein
MSWIMKQIDKLAASQVDKQLAKQRAETSARIRQLVEEYSPEYPPDSWTPLTRALEQVIRERGGDPSKLSRCSIARSISCA